MDQIQDPKAIGGEDTWETDTRAHTGSWHGI
jgi:hypothetical protein